MRIRRGGPLHKLLRRLAEHARTSARDHAMLEEALNHAYEGFLISDVNGFILKANDAYAAFLDLRHEDMIGRHVTEVVENTRMHVVAKTGVPEIAQLQRIKGHDMICHRIPVFERGKVVAVVGRVLFRDVDELFAMTGRFAALKKELEFCQDDGARPSTPSRILGHERHPGAGQSARAQGGAERYDGPYPGREPTGKELFSHAIHRGSARSLGPFVKVNSAAIPETLFESELFGYKAGGFTGANRNGRKGKFCAVHPPSRGRGRARPPRVMCLPPF